MFWPIIFVGAIATFNYFVPSKYRLIVFKSKTIKLGTLSVDETTLLEWKPLFSLKTFYFHKGDAQEIYHTHSFGAISVLLHGNYMEAFFDPIGNNFWEEARNRSRVIYIPRDRYHQITKSEGCRTVMMTGPWADCYKEYNPTTGEIIISTHGRKEIARQVIHYH
jgi:hypothetical protein